MLQNIYFLVVATEIHTVEQEYVILRRWDVTENRNLSFTLGGENQTKYILLLLLKLLNY